MPITLEVKETEHKATAEKKKLGFPDLPPTWGVMVYGPRELWNKKLRDHLGMEGLMRAKSKVPGQETWYLRSTVCPPPLHLGLTTPSFAPMQMTKEFKFMLDRAMKRVEQDDDDFYDMRFDDAGDAPLQVRAAGPWFIANCSKSNKARERLMVGAGWRRFKLNMENENHRMVAKNFGSAPMVTQLGLMASRFFAVMDDAAKRRLMEALAEENRNIRWSRATTVPPDFPIQSIPMPEGESLQPFQIVGAGNILRQKKSGMILDDMGLGKAQPLDAKILTPSGWRRMGDIRKGDLVMGSNGRPTRVTGVYPQGEKQIFRVTFSDGASTECCDEHLWAVNTPVRKRRGVPARVLSLAEIRHDLHDAAGNRKHYIEMVRPVEFAGNDLPEDLYARGCDIAADKSPQKSIPREYLTGSAKQRLTFLQGVMDTQCHVTKNSSLRVSTKATKFACGLVEIVQSLGGVARMRLQGDYHIVTIALTSDITPFRMASRIIGSIPRVKYQPSRAIANVEPVGRKLAQCISVEAEDHLYVTDDYILTHNTVQYIAVLNGRPEFRKILITCKANMKGGWKKAVERFSVRDVPLKVGVASGDYWPEDAEVVVINYDICDRHAAKIKSILWDSWGIDEGHSISNEDAQRTQALLGDFKDRFNPPRGVRVKRDGLIVNLTGTPHPKVSRRWTTLSAVRPEIWGSGWDDKIDYMNRYAPPRLIAQEREGKNGKGSYIGIVPLEGNPMREAEFNYVMRASGTATRRLKSEMADILPPKSRYSIELPVQIAAGDYEQLAEREADVMAILNNVRESQRLGNLSAIESEEERAKAIIDTIKGFPPDSPEFEKISRLRSNIGKIKAPFIADYILESVQGDEELPPELRPKSVIFLHHKDVIAEVRRRIEEVMPGSTITYDGSVSEKKRDGLIEEFQNGNKKRFFIMSLSGASGITLTRANRLYIGEMDWDPLNIAQIEDRIWRIGQMLPCLIGYMFAEKTLDLLIGNTVVRKMTTLMRAYDRMDVSGVNPLKKEKKPDDAFAMTFMDDRPDPQRDDRQGELLL